MLLAGNPAASFFYLLTAMHGLHVIGDLVGWWVEARGVWRQADPASVAWRITLCARYWHFLLVVGRAICGHGFADPRTGSRDLRPTAALISESL